MHPLVGILFFWTCSTLVGSQFQHSSQHIFQRNTNDRLNPAAVSNAIQDLGLSLSTVLDVRNGNLVLSPLSIGTMLGVLLLAARKNTYTQIAKVMQYDNLHDTVIHESTQKILGSLSGPDLGVQLDMANIIYFQQHFPIVQQYLQISQTLYNVSTVGADFINNGTLTRHLINDWVKRHTGGKIKELFRRNFSKDTRLVAVNAVYFNGDWLLPFSKDLTDEKNGYFHISNRQKISIPMMRNIMKVKYIDSDSIKSQICFTEIGFNMVALPYKGERFSMYILVPRGEPSVDTLRKFEANLYSDCLANYINSMEKKSVSIHLPRMKLSSKAMSLKRSLQKLGIQDLFDRTKVDLGRMISVEGAFINDIVHEAIIEINEVGTTAAAATGTTFDRTGGQKIIKVNKPSILFIRDENYKVILFWANVISPEAIVN